MGFGGGFGGGGGGGFGAFTARAEERQKREVKDTELLRRLWNYAKHYKKNLITGIVCVVLGSITGLFSPYLHKIAIDQIIEPNNLSAFIWWIPLFVIIAVGNYLLQYIQIYQMRIVGERVIERFREDMITRLQTISLRYFAEGEIGRILSRPTNDANAVRIFMRQGMSSMIMFGTSITGALVIIFFLDLRLALIAVAILPFGMAYTYLSGKYARRAQRTALSHLAGLTGKTQENFSGMRVIKAFTRENRSEKDFDDVAEDVAKANNHAIVITSTIQPVIMLLRVVGTAMVLFYGALLVKSGEISVGTLLAFIEYQMMYFNPMIQLTIIYDQYQNAMAAVERMFDLVDTADEVKDLSADKAIKIGDLKSVTFDNVSFGYDQRVPVIKNISFDLDQSRKLAIVGPTGAGKSTIINLIERFYDPSDGRILVNGSDMKDIRIADLRSHMSTVLQDSFLFPMCVKDNIRFGKPDATDDDVIAAAKTVGAHEFIMKLPGGYEYVIQENSTNISIGQRQLISFARTLLMDPKLLILDEATSSIDPYTELVLQSALQKLLKGRLAIIIAHRLSTIRLCDQILVIDHGTIVERGTHAELMEKGGLYSSFYKMQFREEKGI